MSRPVPPVAVAALAGILLAALVPAATPAAAPPPSPPIVPRPDVSQVEPTLGRWLESLQREVARLVGAAPLDAALAAAALGDLGRVYHVFGLDASAAEAYAGAAALAPEEFRWTYLRAVLALETADVVVAERELRRALVISPDSPPVLLRLGDLTLERGQPEEARALYQRVLARQPDAAAALYGLGRALAALGDEAGAVACFEKVLVLEPEASVVHYPLGQAYRRLGRTEEAARHLAARGVRAPSFPDPPADELEDFKNLVALQVTASLAADPGAHEPEEILGFALAHLGKVEGALEPLLAVLAQRQAAGAPAGEMARLEYLAGGFLVRKDRDAEAIPHFERSVAHLPEFAAARTMLANALARLGRWAEAVEAYTAVLARRPDDADLPDLVDLLHRRATARLYLGELVAAREDLDAVLARDPQHVEARRSLAALHGALGRYEEALAEYGRLLAKEPDDEAARAGEAGALLLLGRFGDARRRLEEHLALGADGRKLQHLLARLLASAPDPAVRDGRRAVELALAVAAAAPSAVASETVAMAYAEAGDFTEAVRWQERAAGEGPADAARLDLYRRGQPYRVRDPGDLLIPLP